MNSTRSKYWTTAEGETIAIRKMTDSHLMNTMAFLVRRNEESIGITISAACSMDPRYPGLVGYMVQSVKVQPTRDVHETYPIYTDLMLEARRRALV